jgi:gas vesicle protein
MELSSEVYLALNAALIAIIGAVSAFVIAFLRKKSEELQQKTVNKTIDKYIGIAEDIITTAVVAVNQTFVDELKRGGAFTPERQEEAFTRCKDIVLKLILEESKGAVECLYGDFNKWLTSKIEYYVGVSKSGIPVATVIGGAE